jgi:hypothetical protein
MLQMPAVISRCSQYRYSLRREIQRSLIPDQHGAETRPLVFILLNPSTADASTDDNTVRRCIGYAEAWQYSPLIVVNLFALRATNPSELYAARDPVGPLNDEAIMEAACYADVEGGIIVCGWGNHGAHFGRDKAVRELLAGIPLHCLQLNSNGAGPQPTHPLYLSSALKPIPLP